MKYLTLTLTLAFVCSCGWPISPDKMPGVIQALGKDTASGCFAIAGRGGGGTVVVPVPAAPGGAYGSGEVLFARVNAPGTKITLTINGAACTIERSGGSTITTTDDRGLPVVRSTIP